MVLPLVGSRRVRGALVVGRLAGRPQFTPADLDMATTFANHAAVALELADARTAQEQVTLLEDRDRIARDLHDHVMQRLFGAGMTVESVAAGLEPDPRADRLGRVVREIDDTIRQIRTSIFQLRGPFGPRTGAVRSQLLSVCAEAASVLGFAPAVSFSGPVDAVISHALLDDLVAVVREALSNVARHADATSVRVNVTVTHGELLLQIDDDGMGIGPTARRSGLANLQERAGRRGGNLQVTSPRRGTEGTEGGTSLRWTIPMT
jgi:signal transduction histidine kinase